LLLALALALAGCSGQVPTVSGPVASEPPGPPASSALPTVSMSAVSSMPSATIASATAGSDGEAAAQPAAWWVDPSALPLAPSATRFRAIVVESACASGASPEGRVLDPIVEYGPTSIIVTIEIRRRPGGHDCQGNPEYPLDLLLVEPIGGRALLDGGVDPPRDATIPPEPYGYVTP
jgi:hypothetical protein